VRDFETSRLVKRLKSESKEGSGRVAFVLKRLFLGISLKSQEQFYFQLHTMLSAGVSIRDCLHTLAGQHGGRAGRHFREAADDVQGGRPLSGAFARRPWVYGRFAIAMLRAGESSGRMDDNIRLVAQQIEAFRRVRTKVITALMYPLVMLHLGPLILGLPVLLGPNGGLGPYLRVVFLEFLLPIYLVVFVLFIAHQVLRTTNFYSELILSLFVFGSVAKKSALARFSRALACLYDAGIPLARAVDVSLESAENGGIRKAIREATVGLHSGESFASCMQSARHVPPMVKNMLATGEHSGSLGAMLRKIAEFYEHEAAAAIERMAKVIPILIYLVMCGYFAYVIISFYTQRYADILKLL